MNFERLESTVDQLVHGMHNQMRGQAQAPSDADTPNLSTQTVDMMLEIRKQRIR
jgi:hypothetical protein